MPPFNHFDFLSPIYDRFIRFSDPTRFIELVGLPTRGWLLDAGGGTGRKSFPLLSMVSGIIIADSSIGMLSQARNKGRLVTICCETEHLPFLDGYFDRVIMVDALHHVADYRFTTRELWRLTKPGGRIVIEEPDIQERSVKIVAVIERLLLMRSQFISPQDIAKTFHYENSHVTIETEAPNAWIVVDKI